MADHGIFFDELLLRLSWDRDTSGIIFLANIRLFFSIEDASCSTDTSSSVKQTGPGEVLER